jgi:hypothetical protein
MEKLKLYNDFINEAIFDIETELMNWLNEENDEKLSANLIDFIRTKTRGNVVDLGGGKCFLSIYPFFKDASNEENVKFIKAKNKNSAILVTILINEDFNITPNEIGREFSEYFPTTSSVEGYAHIMDISKDVNYL